MVPYEIHVVPFGREEDFTRFLSGRGAAARPSPEERVGARFDSGAGMLVRSRRRYPARALVENQLHSTLEAGTEVARVVERFCRPESIAGTFAAPDLRARRVLDAGPTSNLDVGSSE